MKVIYVITRSDVIGGASVHILDLAKGVQNIGHEVVILAGGDGILFVRAADAGLECISIKNLARNLNPINDMRSFFDLRKIFKKYKPDLVHAHSSKAGLLGRLAARSLNIPVIFTAHGWAFTEGVGKLKRTIYKYVEKIAANFSSAIITVSDYDRHLALSSEVGNQKLITTVHNGIPNDVTINGDRKSKTHLCKLIMVARFDYQKNHHDLFYALANITEYDWSFDLVGDGPLLNEMKLLSERLKINDKVNFVGASSNVSKFLSEADIFVLISNWEGLPLTILEAMRSSLPVIASNVGGVEESVINNKNGFLIERGDIDELSSCLKKLIKSPDIRKSMGEYSRGLYEESFTFEHMLESTLDVYNQVLEIS